MENIIYFIKNQKYNPVHKMPFRYLLLPQLINTFINTILFFINKHSCDLLSICVTIQFMKKDMLLVNPPITLEERYGSFASVGSQAPPLGLCYLAASVRKHGYSAGIIDAPALDMDITRTVAVIAASEADLIGITASTVSIFRASELAKAIKKSGVQAPILLGGPHVSSLPRETLEEFSEFDMGIISEGEYTVPEIISWHKEGGSIAEIAGLVYRRENEVVLSPPRENIMDLDNLPYPCLLYTSDAADDASSV